MNANFITIDMVWSYAEACISIQDKIKILREEGYNLLVIPSRGASPFIHGSNSYLYATTPEGESFRPITKLYLPFTADVSDDFAVESAAIRGFWARVLAAVLRGDSKDLALRFYDRIFNQEALLSPYAYSYKERKCIFIDTVVSGRAICEIIDAFDREGIHNCHYLLLIDENGGKLRPEYRAKLEGARREGWVTLIRVAKIFTEDEGPAMSGIWTVTVPTLMIAAREMIPGFKEANITGAGLYYHEVQKRKDESNLSITLSNAKLSVMIHSAVTTSDVTEHFLEEFKEHIMGQELQNQSITKQIAEPVIRKKLGFIDDLDVSGSHVLRGHMSERNAEKLVKEFLESKE